LSAAALVPAESLQIVPIGEWAPENRGERKTGKKEKGEGTKKEGDMRDEKAKGSDTTE